MAAAAGHVTVGISAVIVNYNAGALLAASAGRVLADPAVAEVWVVDNASRDDSLLALRLAHGGDPRLRILENPANLGFARAANRAIARARGDPILLLNPDNLIESGTLAALAAILERDPRAGMLGCRICNPDGKEQRGGRRRLPTLGRALADFIGLRGAGRYDLSGDALPEGPVPVEAISGSFMLLKRSAVERVGGLDEGYFLHCEDLDWCKRFADAGYRILFAPHVTCTHYQGRCSAGRPWRVEWHKHRGMWRYYRKHQRGPGLAVAGLLVWLHLPIAGLRALSKRRAGRDDDQPDRPASDATAPRGEAVLVLGGASLVGQYLLPALVQAGRRVIALTRRPTGRPAHPQLAWRPQASPGHGALEAATDVISLAPIWVTAERLEGLGPLRPRRVVVLSSTSIETKQASRSPRERAIVGRLRDGERRVRAWADRHGATLVILRPTMIYGQGRDRNVAFIGRWLERWRFFPVVGSGRRQPVHAGDVAAAAVAALGAPPGTYVLGGGECLPFADLVRRVGALLHRPVRLVALPVGPLRRLLALLRWLPGLGFLEPDMVDRMRVDLCVDNRPLETLVGCRPRGFLAEGGGTPMALEPVEAGS